MWPGSPALSKPNSAHWDPEFLLLKGGLWYKISKGMAAETALSPMFPLADVITSEAGSPVGNDLQQPWCPPASGKSPRPFIRSLIHIRVWCLEGPHAHLESCSREQPHNRNPPGTGHVGSKRWRRCCQKCAVGHIC